MSKLKKDWRGDIVDGGGKVVFPAGTWSQCSKSLPGALEVELPFGRAFVASNKAIEEAQKRGSEATPEFYFDIVNDMYADNPTYITLNVRPVEGLGRSPHSVAIYRGGKLRLGHGRTGEYKALLDKNEGALEKALAVLREAGPKWEGCLHPSEWDGEEIIALIRERGYEASYSWYD